MDFKNIPIIGDIDFSDPEKRKSSLRICAAGAMVVFVLIAIVVRKAMDKKAEALAQTAQQEQYASLEIPFGDSKEDIGGKTMKDISRRRGTPGGHAKDYNLDDIMSEDPLAALSGEESSSGKITKDPLKDAEDDNLPGFMKRHQAGSEEGQSSPSQMVSGGKTTENGSKSARKSQEKPGEAASRAILGKNQGIETGDKRLEDMTFEERRRYLYLKNGLDPDTGEPIVGGQYDADAQYQSARAATPGSGKKASGGSSNASKPSSENASTAATTPTSQSPANESKEPAVEPSRVQVRRSGGVSAFGMSGSTAGTSISTLGDADEYVSDDPTHLFKVKFAYNEKVSSGQRVTLRLCEDMVVDGVLIPENTHLFATCSVGERLELKVSSININGKIYTIDYVAYDNDGAQGLYCPQTETSKALQQAGETAGQIAQQAISSAVTGYPGRIFNAGTQIVSTKKGKTTISVTAGYSFYLMQAK